MMQSRIREQGEGVKPRRNPFEVPFATMSSYNEFCSPSARNKPDMSLQGRMCINLFCLLPRLKALVLFVHSFEGPFDAHG